MGPSSKNFRKRAAILAYLKESKAHPSAETIYADLKSEIPDLSLGTVYRNLNIFKQQGQVISLGTVAGVERFDGHTQPHVHFICQECADVTDLPEMTIPTHLTDTAAKFTNGCIQDCQLTFSGTCQYCLAKKEAI